MSVAVHTSAVAEGDDDIRLDRWFKRHYPALPHAMLEKYLRKGLVRLDGKKASSSDRVHTGQMLSHPSINEVERDQKSKPVASEQDMAELRRSVIYKDEQIIIVNKPYGLAVQGGTKITRSVDGLLDGLKFDNAERPKLVHRLDRDTSGVLVLARNAKSAAILAKAFAGKTIDKTYWALVNGVPQPEAGYIDLPLLKAVKGEFSHERVGVDEEEGKYARTEYWVIESLPKRYAFVKLKPLTGRTHQLRVHMEAIGCPIVGDGKYGGHTDYDARALGVEDKLHLHARRIVIPASLLGRGIDVTAPLPEHMRVSVKALGMEVPK